MVCWGSLWFSQTLLYQEGEKELLLLAIQKNIRAPLCVCAAAYIWARRWNRRHHVACPIREVDGLGRPIGERGWLVDRPIMS